MRYADGYFEDLSFVDILRLIPKSWWRIDAESNVALILENLYKARLNAIILTAAVSVPQFTLPNSHKAAMAAPDRDYCCLLYTSPSPRDGLLSRMPSSA